MQNLNANEHRIVLHGHANHFNDTDRVGGNFNEKNYGIGYEYTSYDGIDNDWFIEPVYGLSVNIIQDSYKRIFPFAGIFGEIRTKGFVGVGINISAFVGSKELNKTKKNVNYNNTTGKFDFTYENIGTERLPIFGATPGVKIYVGDFSFNYNYSPEFEGFGIYADGFHYFSLSYKFN